MLDIEGSMGVYSSVAHNNKE